MYFTNFDSFITAQENAKSFVVEVLLVDGDQCVGSPLPAKAYDQVMADIAACDELKTTFAVWSRELDGKLVFIPYDKIKMISVRFIQ